LARRSEHANGASAVKKRMDDAGSRPCLAIDGREAAFAGAARTDEP
jgi:hypothetical protein